MTDRAGKERGTRCLSGELLIASSTENEGSGELSPGEERYMTFASIPVDQHSEYLMVRRIEKGGK